MLKKILRKNSKISELEAIWMYLTPFVSSFLFWNRLPINYSNKFFKYGNLETEFLLKKLLITIFKIIYNIYIIYNIIY